MVKIKFIGEKESSLKLIDGGELGQIMPNSIINVPQKDFDSLLDLAKRTPKPEWELPKEVN